jgi:hypothetical protein
VGLFVLCSCVLGALPTGAQVGKPAAQQGKPGASKAKRQPLPEDFLPQSELDDPIGLDADSRTLEQAVPKSAVPPSDAALEAERERFGPDKPALAVRAGEVVTALQAIRESAHRVKVELTPGMTEVSVELVLSSLAARPAEARYRLAVPDHTELLTLEVCKGTVLGNSESPGSSGGRGPRNGVGVSEFPRTVSCRIGLVEGVGVGLSAYDASVHARPRGKGGKPVAHARLLRDERGEAIVLRAAPIVQGAPLLLKVRYRTLVPAYGGVLRLSLPARGMDPQVAPTELSVTLAKGLLDGRVGRDPIGAQAVPIDAWSSVELSARLPTGSPTRTGSAHGACHDGACGTAFAVAAPGPLSAADMVLALDASPSTEGPARGRIVPAIATLLTTAPEGSRVRALSFAARAQPLVSDALEPSALSLAPLQQAVDVAELGSATRFEAVWSLAGDWLGKKQRAAGKKPLIVIIGDGGLTLGEARAFERARAAGVEVSSVNTGSRPSSPALRAAVSRTGGVALDVGAEAGDAAIGRDPARLGERLQALFARTLAPRVRVTIDGKPRELGALRAGDTLSFRGTARGLPGLSGVTGAARPRGAVSHAALAAVDPADLREGADRDWPEPPKSSKATCDRRGPAYRAGGIDADAMPVALAEERQCKPVPKALAKAGSSDDAQIGIGMPADPLLDMLRRRVMPVARGCFRRDRGGRAQYQKRAVFAFTLAEREVVDAHIEGPIPEALKDCLLTAVDTLEVPRFTGLVTVRYPLITESLPLPEQLELRPATAGTLDALFGDERPPERPSPTRSAAVRPHPRR